jgi:nitrite reductase/ring-hydroxylating ferredoxin subunit
MRVLLGGAADFAPGTLTKVAVDHHAPLVVGNVEGTLFAMLDECNHGEADLSEGALVGREIVCPLHGGCFDVMTGKATKRPAKRPQPVFAIEVVGDEIYVDLVDSSALKHTDEAASSF